MPGLQHKSRLYMKEQLSPAPTGYPTPAIRSPFSPSAPAMLHERSMSCSRPLSSGAAGGAAWSCAPFTTILPRLTRPHSSPPRLRTGLSLARLEARAALDKADERTYVALRADPRTVEMYPEGAKAVSQCSWTARMHPMARWPTTVDGSKQQGAPHWHYQSIRRRGLAAGRARVPLRERGIASSIHASPSPEAGVGLAAPKEAVLSVMVANRFGAGKRHTLMDEHAFRLAVQCALFK